MTVNTERKDTRVVARVSSDIQEIIQRAADYTGATVSQFLIDSAMCRARDIIEQTETLHLSMSGARTMMSVLDNPPKANTKLLKAAKGYKDSVHAHKD
ncbi:DUF1778 domain-containing protein [Salmonella enterica subsp. enterica serovar Oranienburg]|nr:DUF1778 domain-containing protein [Salmonella enterica]EBG5027424.1 DUF1778 domain-containing protein [Salmonella enterica subsp. enterica serovar Oranienburg]EAS1264930.1 DUF1778 domain-containing protein [Salmonella enterica]EBB1607855.1 DUF1778 domain-containing protein [Salmonella enterica]EBB9534545.1 DUF1778 domain-containing protein [Salmonella enterica]